jgi:hypothetical protein
VLQIGRAQRGVGVGGVAEQGAKIVLRAGPLVETAGDGDGDADLPSVGILGEVQGVDGRVHEVADQVPDRRGADKGNEQIGTWADVVAPHGVAERAWPIWQAGLAGDVDHAPQADGRIDHEPYAGRARARGTELEHVIDDHHRLGQVDQNVVDRLADRSGREHPVDPSGGTDQIAVNHFLDSEALAIESLERIAGGGGGRLTDAKGADRERHAGGKAPCAHGSLHNSRVSGQRPD